MGTKWELSIKNLGEKRPHANCGPARGPFLEALHPQSSADLHHIREESGESKTVSQVSFSSVTVHLTNIVLTNFRSCVGSNYKWRHIVRHSDLVEPEVDPGHYEPGAEHGAVGALHHTWGGAPRLCLSSTNPAPTPQF